MYTLYQLVSRIPLPTSLTLGHPPGEGLWDGKPVPYSPRNGNLLGRKKDYPW